MTSSSSSLSSSAMDIDNDAQAYNEYASAAFELSHGHVSNDGLFTVTRSVRDIDNHQRRRYLYSMYLPPSQDDNDAHDDDDKIPMKMKIPPPVECHASMEWRLPSPSGAKVAILRKDDSNNKNNKDDSSLPPQILEIWVDGGHTLQRRIRLPSPSQHGKVIHDAGGFGRPAWNAEETVLVYVAERNPAKTSSFFDETDSNSNNNNNKSKSIRGGQYTLGLGQMEHWGEKYSQQSPLLDLYCVHVETGRVGKVENVPTTCSSSSEADDNDDKKKQHGQKNDDDATLLLGDYTLGQPVFTPNGDGIVYVGWHAGGNSGSSDSMPRRLGMVYCQQRPSQLYCSSVLHLLKRLSSSSSTLAIQDDGNDKDADDKKRLLSSHNDNDLPKDEGFEILTPNLRLARSPRFSPSSPVYQPQQRSVDQQDDVADTTTTTGTGTGDKEEEEAAAATLVFLGSEEGFDTHSGCLALYALEWKAVVASRGGSSGTTMDGALQDEAATAGSSQRPRCRVVVPEVWDPRQSPARFGTVWGLPFPGLYLQEIPESCFVSPHHLLLTTQWGSISKVVCVSLPDGEVALVRCSSSGGGGGDDSEDEDASCSSDALLCVTPDGRAIVKTNAPNRPGVVSLVQLPDLSLLSSSTKEEEKEGSKSICNILSAKPIASTRFSALSPELKNAFLFTHGMDVRKPPAVPGVDFDLDIQSVLLLPRGDAANSPEESSSKPPLIVVPHGGPHSVSTTNYLPSYAFLCGHGGYAILLVNYRGSTGFGQGSINALPTRIGNLDVSDVVSVTRHVRDSGLVDPDRIGICGGSHGGFLTGHCTGQFPELFKAAAMRNPVVNICSMTTATDIADWCFVEACGRYQWSEYRPPNREELLTMHEKSPVRHVSKVRTPTLVALGLSDLRVPPSQGLEWYHTLRSMGVPTKLLTYEKDDHAIAGVQSEADHWVNIKQWFDRYLK